MSKILILFAVILLISPIACKNDSKEPEKKTVNLTDARIKLYINKITNDPTSYIYYNNLAQNYIQKARETGDTDYYKEAEKTLDKSLDINPKNYVGMVLFAKTELAKHDFKNALQYAKKAVELNPERSVAYGILGDAYLEFGEIDEAASAYEKMAGINPNLDSYSRISNLKVVKGDTEAAITAMQNAYNSSLKKALPKENTAWTQVMLGSIYFNSGNLDAAEAHYKKALEIFDDYYLALEHIAEINAARGNFIEAEKIYKNVLELNPAPEFYLALAGVYENLGKPSEAEKLNNKALQIYEKNVYELKDNGYLRPLALYYSENNMNLDKALELAKKDMEIRSDVHVYDTLGWVYYNRGEYEKALEQANRSLEHGTKDANIFYHLGMINYKMNNFDEAKSYLNQALETNPYFDSNAVESAKNILKEIQNL